MNKLAKKEAVRKAKEAERLEKGIDNTADGGGAKAAIEVDESFAHLYVMRIDMLMFRRLLLCFVVAIYLVVGARGSADPLPS